MMKIKVSVIIAAYNAEKYLRKALESILHQSMKPDEYEVIVVDDGSRDETSDILKGYVRRCGGLEMTETGENSSRMDKRDDPAGKKYRDIGKKTGRVWPRFLVIHQKNGGPSSARNTGLKYADGEFVYFFDSDDIAEKDALECMYRRASEQQADLVVAGYDQFNILKYMQVHVIDALTQKTDISHYDPDLLQTFVLWNKLYRKSIIDQHGIQFRDVCYSEDGIFLFEYLHDCGKITGLPRKVIHYRRSYEEGSSAITATVTAEKVSDYVRAHQMIIEQVKKNIRKDFPQYDTYEEADADNRAIHDYVDAIRKKEMKILLKRFFGAIWSLDQTVLGRVCDAITMCLQQMDLSAILSLEEDFPEYSLFHMEKTQKEAMEHAAFTCALWGEADTGLNVESFLNSLRSLCRQEFVYIRIVLPEHMRSLVESYGKDGGQDVVFPQNNIVYLSCTEKNRWIPEVIRQCSTPFLLFAGSHYLYSPGMIRAKYYRMRKTPLDFLVDAVNHRDFGGEQMTLYSRIAKDETAVILEDHPALCLENTMANKFFSTDFLKSQMRFYTGCGRDQMREFIRLLFLHGYSKRLNSTNVIYQGTEAEYYQEIRTDASDRYLKRCLGTPDMKIDLNHREFRFRPEVHAMKFRPFKEMGTAGDKVREMLPVWMKEPLQDQALFVSVRTDNRLTGDAALLCRILQCKKSICAHALPHADETVLEMSEKIMTSRVIVIDEDIPYLRFLPLRKEQRVIRLGHCGAMEKFGQRNSLLPVSVERSTHHQYSLVCVSSEAMREIYADAFDVEPAKVRALGVLRTDRFCDPKLQKQIRTKIYLKHPELFGRQVIVYMPACRENGEDETRFWRQMDFLRLSENLRHRQTLVICPHPSMKEGIVPENYKNIHVLRDFSREAYLMAADLLITDYAPELFEYLLLKKPVVFYCPDLPHYRQKLYPQYPDELPGEVCTTMKELIRCLGNRKRQEITEKYRKFADHYMSACDGHSAERIASVVEAYLKNEE